MTLLEIIKDAIEDLTSVKIATLHGGDIPLNSAVDKEAKDKIEEKIASQKKEVDDSRIKWLDAEDNSDRRKYRRVHIAAKRRMMELKMELHSVSPRDIFNKIEIAMGQASTAGYSKYLLSSNSVNFLNSSLGEDKKFILDAHDLNVKTALEARQRLINSAVDLIKLGQSL